MRVRVRSILHKRFGALARTLGALRSARDGAAILEFAFVAPILLLFLVGIIEFGRAIWTNYSLETAVQETTRYVLANPTASDAQIITRVGSRLSLVDANNVTITVTRSTVGGVNFVSVSAVYPFSTLTALFPGAAFNLTGRSRVPLTAPT